MHVTARHQGLAPWPGGSHTLPQTLSSPQPCQPAPWGTQGHCGGPHGTTVSQEPCMPHRSSYWAFSKALASIAAPAQPISAALPQLITPNPLAEWIYPILKMDGRSEISKKMELPEFSQEERAGKLQWAPLGCCILWEHAWPQWWPTCILNAYSQDGYD